MNTDLKHLPEEHPLAERWQQQKQEAERESHNLRLAKVHGLIRPLIPPEQQKG